MWGIFICGGGGIAPLRILNNISFLLSWCKRINPTSNELGNYSFCSFLTRQKEPKTAFTVKGNCFAPFILTTACLFFLSVRTHFRCFIHYCCLQWFDSKKHCYLNRFFSGSVVWKERKEFLKPWKKFSTFQTIFGRSIEKRKKHLGKVSFFLNRFFWRSKKND